MAKMYGKSKMGRQTVGTASKKGEFDKRFNRMKTEAELYNSSWKTLSEYLNPTRGQFDESTPERGTMIDHKTILDSHATNAIRKTASGLNSGITSKSRPWFRLTLAEEELADNPVARLWLDEVQKRMYAVLEGSNIYGTFQNTYEELLTFGTGCFILLEDFDTVIRTRNFTAGEYFLAVDKSGRISSYARSFEMTVAQLIDSFGYDKCPSTIQSAWDNNDVDQTFRVRHLIEQNDNPCIQMEEFADFPFRSAYWIEGDQAEDEFLDVRGFKRFPVVAPRWSVPTTDIIYGYGPGWDALGDVKELQKTKYDKLLAQEKLHNPPMQSDGNVEGFVNLLPGGVTKTSANVPNAGLTPAYQINPNLESFIEIINECKHNIDKHFFTDLFTMLAVLDRGQMTAREVSAREQERIMLMGPILNQLDEEMLSKVISLTFGIMMDNGLIPPPPPELEGRELKVQYISILAQMQRAVGTSSIEKVVGYVGMIAPVNPDAVDVIDWDESIRQYAKMEGVPEKILQDPAFVDEIRQAKAQQMQMQQAMMGADSASKTAKTMSETELDKNSALDGLRKTMSAG